MREHLQERPRGSALPLNEQNSENPLFAAANNNLWPLTTPGAPEPSPLASNNGAPPYHMDSSCRDACDGRCPDTLNYFKNRVTYHLAMNQLCVHRHLL